MQLLKFRHCEETTFLQKSNIQRTFTASVSCDVSWWLQSELESRVKKTSLEKAIAVEDLESEAPKDNPGQTPVVSFNTQYSTTFKMGHLLLVMWCKVFSNQIQKNILRIDELFKADSVVKSHLDDSLFCTDIEKSEISPILVDKITVSHTGQMSSDVKFIQSMKIKSFLQIHNVQTRNRCWSYNGANMTGHMTGF